MAHDIETVEILSDVVAKQSALGRVPTTKTAHFVNYKEQTRH